MQGIIDVEKITVFNVRRKEDEVPLVVDIDGTIIDTDLLFEALILMIRKNPLYIFKCLLWVFKGTAYLKSKIFSVVELDYRLLPYNTDVMNFIRKEFAMGRKIILASASPIAAVVGISKNHPVFSELFGTENNINLKGKNKLKILINRFGRGKFDYIGNSRADQVIFAASRQSYLVNPTASVERKARRISNLQLSWYSGKPTIKDYLREIRVHQWVKNLLIFIPLITSHSFYSLHAMALTSGAFFAFSLVASSGYLFNDILDIHSDRNHPKKRFRAVAAGKISVMNAAILAIIFFSSGLFFAAKYNALFFYTVIFYFITSLAYSLFLKKLVLYDVFILAALYSTRIFAGGVVITVLLSFWLIVFSAFIFLSLAFLKRYAEFVLIKDATILKKQNRGYLPEDITLLQIMGVASGFLAIVVFALYIESPDVKILYARPQMLYFIIFLLLFWISRMWLLTSRGKMTGDPIVFALKDVTSYFVFLICGLLLISAL
jgi:4-hydroxybenzoate polyprenyltransferase